MTTGTSRCPRCGEPIPAGTRDHRCAGSDDRTIQVETLPTRRKQEDSLDDTVAYRGEIGLIDPEDDESAPEEFDDGFPEIDDLVDSELGQYRLASIVGRGSMGRVYRGVHLGLGRQCAVKVMNPGLVAKHPQIRERFWDEARAVANLLHPHVVTIHNLGSARGYHYIEMEYVSGGITLSESLVREGPFDPIRASTLVRQVVLAL